MTIDWRALYYNYIVILVILLGILSLIYTINVLVNNEYWGDQILLSSYYLNYHWYLERLALLAFDFQVCVILVTSVYCIFM